MTNPHLAHARVLDAAKTIGCVVITTEGVEYDANPCDGGPVAPLDPIIMSRPEVSIIVAFHGAYDDPVNASTLAAIESAADALTEAVRRFRHHGDAP